MTEFLYDHQKKAIPKIHNGCILNGGVGSGKSRTALYYFFQLYGGSFENHRYVKMKNPCDLYIITTAQKRDKGEWDLELAPFRMSRNKESTLYKKQKIVIDSWNNITKYKDVQNAFFIFDEQRVVGYGTWVKSFLKIAKANCWILLSATPGDKWADYIPVFIANGFYKNKTDFNRQHVVFSRFTKWPQITGYVNTRKLERLRNRILVDMEFDRKTVRHDINIKCDYDSALYKLAYRNRWDIYRNEPIQQASNMCYVLRQIINTDESRSEAVLKLVEEHPKAIIFYNFDYELEILRHINYPKGTKIAEWNGHHHQDIPDGSKWVYLVQYTAGCEGWNCVKTDTIIFYSQNYSYKVLEQARGRIDRLNTAYIDLYYYHLKSSAGIDLAIGRALSKKKKFVEGSYVKF